MIHSIFIIENRFQSEKLPFRRYFISIYTNSCRQNTRLWNFEKKNKKTGKHMKLFQCANLAKLLSAFLEARYIVRYINMCSKIVNALKINKNCFRYSTKNPLRSDTYEYNWKSYCDKTPYTHTDLFWYLKKIIKNTLFKIYWKSPKFNIFAF